MWEKKERLSIFQASLTPREEHKEQQSNLSARKGLPTHPLEARPGLGNWREAIADTFCHVLQCHISRGSGRRHQKREADKLAMTALNPFFVWGSCACEWPCMCIHVPRMRKIIFSVEQDLKHRGNRTLVKQSNSYHLQRVRRIKFKTGDKNTTAFL